MERRGIVLPRETWLKVYSLLLLVTLIFRPTNNHPSSSFPLVLPLKSAFQFTGIAKKNWSDHSKRVQKVCRWITGNLQGNETDWLVQCWGYCRIILVFMSSWQKNEVFLWLLQNLCNTEHCCSSGLKPFCHVIFMVTVNPRKPY